MNGKICELCTVFVANAQNGDVWQKHVGGKKHQEKLSRLDAPNGTSQESDGGSSTRGTEQTNQHEQSHRHLLQSLNKTQSVDEQMTMLSALQQLTSDEVQKRAVMIEILEELFRHIFPTCCIVPFGSTVNNFGMRSGDLDLVLFPSGLAAAEHEMFKMEALTVKSLAQKKKKLKIALKRSKLSLDMVVKEVEELGPCDKIDLEKMVGITSNILANSNLQITSIRPLPTASVPIVKFSLMGISCDLSFNNRIVLYNSALLKHYSLMDERIKPLVMTVSYWARYHGIRSSRGHYLTTYCLTWMVLHYLHTEDILPTIKDLMNLSEAKDVLSVDGRKCMALSYSNLPKQRESNKACSLVHLLMNFFKYYNSFDMSNTVICPYSGCLEPLSEFMSENELFQQSLLNVQDPYETSRNVGKTASAAVYEQLRKSLEETCEIITDPNFTIKIEKPFGLEMILSQRNEISEEMKGFSSRGKRKRSTQKELNKVAKT